MKLTKKEKKRFVTDLTNSIKKSVIQSIHSGRVPENWDGIELRKYLADLFEANSVKIVGERLRQYKNDLQNLPL